MNGLRSPVSLSSSPFGCSVGLASHEVVGIFLWDIQDQIQNEFIFGLLPEEYR